MKQINYLGTSDLDAPVKYMIKIDEEAKQITAVGLMDVTDQEGIILPEGIVQPWADHADEVLVASPKMFYNRIDHSIENLHQVFNKVPDQDPETIFTMVWKCTLDINSVGADEWCDYTMLNITTRNGGSVLVGVRARLAESRNYKGDGARYRAHGDYKHAICLYVPFARDNFDNVTMDILARWGYPPHIIGGTVDTVTNENVTPPTGHVWNTRFWRVEQSEPASVSEGGFVDIPIHLEWTADGSICEEVTTLKLEAKSGYVAKTRVTTDAYGMAYIRAGALGLESGDQIEIKVNSHLMQGIGLITAQVN
jgi:hypothetical protein